ncbi:hypothetical protein [Parvibaculum sp.]|jgi:hypothetical protein|uniref:hypothetical protein n=1 Tax=Parvibaculum sp. TaxID=2024848 RepID=UPI000C387FCE|nr:hypothetical protein [Parvibaculum sp.]MAM94389.1 hypothetical protein [Parvibaculum sp.]HCX67672.1 hypothetical protein [Rhodobiaceae bacterium]|tara:strand:- start:4330 stop:4692 length:363 start_codon:yes stop_codon:yes gene_type:complete
MARIATVVLTSLILHGCIFPLGDAATRIEGRITDMKGAAYDRCTIEIFSSDSDEAFNYRQISGEFNEAFVIYPDQAEYKLRFSCDDAEDAHVIEKIALGPRQGPDSAVDVGKIRLERKGS